MFKSFKTYRDLPRCQVPFEFANVVNGYRLGLGVGFPAWRVIDIVRANFTAALTT